MVTVQTSSSGELVLLNKHRILGDGACLHCYQIYKMLTSKDYTAISFVFYLLINQKANIIYPSIATLQPCKQLTQLLD